MEQERDAARGLTALLRRCNARVLALTPGERQQATGWPDRYVAHPYWSGWLELKGPRTRVRPAQVAALRALRAAGARAWVLRFTSEDEVVAEDEGGCAAATLARPKTPRDAAQLLRLLAALDEKRPR